MKKLFYLLSVLALSVFASSGTLRAGPAAPLCPRHQTQCAQKAKVMYCSVTEEVMKNKFLPGRAGLWGWERVPEFEKLSEKCPTMK